MLCKCGGKLTVIDSFQIPTGGGVKVERVRRCVSCNTKIVSYEVVKSATIDKGYLHNRRNYSSETAE